jgi:cytochrome c oxidase assembly protein subunit 11
MTDRTDRTRRTLTRQVMMLGLLATGMFGFAFALAPLYQVFCELTGLSGRTASAPVAQLPEGAPLSDRFVTVQFVAHVNKGMPWEFRPAESRLRVRIGALYTMNYVARNRASGAVTGQAVPSVAPAAASPYMQKVECFCFTEQTLASGEEILMPVIFHLSPDLPADVHTLSLSYSLFRVPDPPSASRAASLDTEGAPRR